MKSVLRVLWLFVLSGSLLSKGQAQDVTPMILSGPSSQNVSVNKKAVFSCLMSNVHLVRWFFNDTSEKDFTTFPKEKYHFPETEDNVRYFLEFDIDTSNSDQLNNTNITCRGLYDNITAVKYEMTDYSEPALLRIQGTLGPPNILSPKVENNTLLLNWNPPFTLTGTVINYYSWNISATISLGPNKTEPFNTTNSTTLQNFSFPEPYNGVCNAYHICIWATSAAGDGETSCLQFSQVKKPLTLTNEDVAVNVTFLSDQINASYTFDRGYCLQRRANIFTLTVTYQQAEPLDFYFPQENYLNSDHPVTVSFTVQQKESAEVDYVSILSLNDAGSTPSDPIKTDLSCIKNLEILADGKFTCLFANGCIANGCQVVIEYNLLNGVNQDSSVFNLTKEEASSVSETGFLSRDVNSTCTANSILVYALYNNSHTSTPDRSFENVNLCITSLTSITAPVTPTSTSPTSPQTDASGNKENIDLLLSVVLPLLTILIVVIFIVAIIIACYKRNRRGEVELNQNMSTPKTALAKTQTENLELKDL